MSIDLDHIQPGSIVGPYRIVRGFRGRGGMARVFEVEVRQKYRQPHLPRRLALKVAREKYQDALVAESDFLRRFDHPNVVRIFPLAGYHRPVYAARESDTLGICSGDVVARMRHPDARCARSLDEAVVWLGTEARPGDVVLTLGAGDGYLVGEWLLEALTNQYVPVAVLEGQLTQGAGESRPHRNNGTGGH